MLIDAGEDLYWSDRMNWLLTSRDVNFFWKCWRWSSRKAVSVPTSVIGGLQGCTETSAPACVQPLIECSFHNSDNRKGRSVTFLHQRPLFLFENQTTVVLSPLLMTCLSQILQWSVRLHLHPTRARAASCMVPMYVIGPNVCELPSVHIKLTDVPIELTEGWESALEHRTSAFTRSRRTFDPSLERSCSCAHVHANSKS